MDWLEGVLLVPPERNQILGRTSWKSRYIVVGRPTASGRDIHGSSGGSQSGGGLVRSNTSGHKSLPKTSSDEYYVSVYKAKDDWEPIQQWPVNSVSDCQVQMLSHKKQGPVLPTLVVTMADKDRKRRSSRAAGLISTNKDSNSVTLWFRSTPDELNPSLQDWARFIMSKKTLPDSGSPVSPVFTSPFAPRTRDPPEYFSQPCSSNRSDSRALQHKSSAATYSTGPRDRPVTFSSTSPSLRSKRSDVSSPSSTNYPIQKMPYVPGQQYTTVLPGDITTSATIPEHYVDFSESWATSYGTTSAMHSTAPGSSGMNSDSQDPSIVDVCAPPAPGETILDRAFQLGHIPGMSPGIPGEEKLSSIAKFDALMREVDSKRKQREGAERAAQTNLRSTFDTGDSSEDDAQNSDDSGSDGDYSHEQQYRSNGLISPSAQRALDFIAGRQEPSRSNRSHRPGMSRAHLSFHADTPISSDQAKASRPHTAHTKNRPNMNKRAQSTPHLAHVPLPNTPNLDVPVPPAKPSNDGSRHQSGKEKRHSNSSVKRSSFTEFTKRLSSTSSLLLVQTNASGGSSRRSSDIDIHATSAPRTNLSLRGAVPPPRNRDDSGRSCSWRSGVGVVGSEGGFL